MTMQLVLIADEGDVIRVSCEGEILAHEMRPRHDPMEDVIGAVGFTRCVLLNMEGTTYLDSSGISWLLICHKHCTESGGKLILHSLPPRVLRILQIVRLPSILHIAEDETGARALASGGGRS
jgi:anti-anti-sigma factor